MTGHDRAGAVRRVSAGSVALGLAMWAPVLLGQQQPVPSFRSGVSIVTIDVTVIDSEGRPVPGLTAADFEVRLNNRPQTIRTAAYIEVARAQPAAKASAPAPAPPVASVAVSGRTVRNVPAPPRPPAPPPPAAAPAGEPRVFVILFDDLSFTPQRGKALVASARTFVDRLPPSDLVGFTTTSGVGPVNPTPDRAAVLGALDKAVGQYSDPRSVRPTGPAGDARNFGTGEPDGGPSLDEALDIDGGNPGLIKEVIARECFNGSMDVFLTRSVAQVIATDQCASDMQSEARRVAALTRQTVARQVGGYLSIVNAMAVGSGIRHLVLLSDGVAIQKEASVLNPLVRAAAKAGVQISVIVEEADINMGDSGRRVQAPGGVPQSDVGKAQRRRSDDKMLLAGAQSVAERTGGSFFRVIGSADVSFDRVALSSSAVYRLGIEPPADTRPGRIFTVDVSLRRPQRLTVRANQQAVAIAPAPPAASPPSAAPAGGAAAPPPAPADLPPIESELRALIDTGKIVTDVPVAAAAMVRRSATSPGLVEVTVDVAIPRSAEGPLTTLLGVIDEKGGIRTAQKVLPVPAGEGSYGTRLLVPIAPGAYKVRFAAADARRQLGSVESTVNARLAPMGPFTASDVLTWYVEGARAQAFALEDIPEAAGATLHASLELYLPEGATPPEGVAVRWALTPTGGGKPMEQESEPNAGQGPLRADAAFELKDVAAGLYMLRAAVVINGAEAGSASTTVRKK